MGEHLHKKFDNEFIISVFQKYLTGYLSVNQILEILGIKRRRFFNLLKNYKNNPNKFSIIYRRKSPKRINPKLEGIIINELKESKKLIDNNEIPLDDYNYSYIKDQIYKNYKLQVSTPTIINRAKENNYYIPKKTKKKQHDREVLTNYPGELIQHDSSQHKFSPYADKKWYLITSIDDHSRSLLYSELLENETSWAHICALENVILRFGIPLKYYVDCHSIFRFVQGRDSFWRIHHKVTDQSVPQWKQVLLDLNINLSYALSAQAKGKVERPYRWMQDRLIRTCARENIKTIDEAKKVLKYEVDRYNNKQLHSTTKEIPYIRFNHALSLNKTLFREFKIPKPYQSTKDIFCLRTERIVDAYHKITFGKIRLKIKGVPLRDKVEIKIVPDNKKKIAECRFWYRNRMVDKHMVKYSDLNVVRF